MTEDCECECEPDVDGFDTGEPTHFTRRCVHCGYEWQALHCPHDGHQNPCPDCERRPETVRCVSIPTGSGAER